TGCLVTRLTRGERAKNALRATKKRWSDGEFRQLPGLRLRLSEDRRRLQGVRQGASAQGVLPRAVHAPLVRRLRGRRGARRRVPRRHPREGVPLGAFRADGGTLWRGRALPSGVGASPERRRREGGRPVHLFRVVIANLGPFGPA